MYTIRLMPILNEFQPSDVKYANSEYALLLDILFNPNKHNFNKFVLGGCLSHNMITAGTACLYPNTATGILNDLRIFTNCDYARDFIKAMRRFISNIEELPANEYTLINNPTNYEPSKPVGFLALFYSQIEEAPMPIPTCILYSDKRYKPLEVLHLIIPKLKEELDKEAN